MATLVAAAGDAAKTGEGVEFATAAATRTAKAAVGLRTQFAFAKLVGTDERAMF